jgi:uncharacterized membrane protein YeiH
MEQALEIINIIGIISFAAAGAMVSINKETDLFGVLLLSLITCFGGGILRDVMVGSGLPLFFTGKLIMEIIVCICTALVVFLLASFFKEHYVKDEATVDKINNVLDALGLGVFASVGTARYIELGAFVAITMGLISSVGGSIIRDVILNEIPLVLRKRVYAVACIIGSSLYFIIHEVVLKDNDSAQMIATICCMAVIFTIRMCATIFHWNIPKAIDFSKMKLDSDKQKIQK